MGGKVVVVFCVVERFPLWPPFLGSVDALAVHAPLSKFSKLLVGNHYGIL